MFTGIVDHYGVIQEIRPSSEGQSLSLQISTRFESLVEGESISVDGVCLTALSPEKGLFCCDLSPETLELSIGRNYRVGTRVNLERALQLSDRLGGYMVTGHVEQRVLLAKSVRTGSFPGIFPGIFIDAFFSGVAPEYRAYLIKKGNIVVNGVSLTINEVLDEGFRLMIIPHTLERTNLGFLESGHWVNLEFDYTTKVIVSETRRLFETMRFS